MSTLTKEWLQQTIAELEEERDAVPGAVNEDAAKALAAMKLALASLEAEPVGFIDAEYTELLKSGHIESCSVYAEPGEGCITLFTAPPAPVSVPDELLSAMEEVLRISDRDHEAWSKTKSAIAACRAAMLQGAEPDFREISNSSTKHFRENAETSTKCWCRTCRPVTFADSHFVVCPECGNKRCPHANDHRHACTGSNEPGQEGSAYPAAPQQEVK